jgi:hypothetical protein
MTSFDNKYYKKYGCVVFPKGFKLYHCGNYDATKSPDHNFILFTTFGAPGALWSKTNALYEVELLCDYPVMLNIRLIHQLRSSIMSDALTEIALECGIKTDFLSAKNKHIDTIVNHLRTIDINGWFGSFETTPHTEICLFATDNSKKYRVTKMENNNLSYSLSYMPPYVHLGTSNKYLPEDEDDQLDFLAEHIAKNGRILSMCHYQWLLVYNGYFSFEKLHKCVTRYRKNLKAQ